MARLEDLKTVLDQSKDHRHRDLVKIANQLRTWFSKVHKMKATYHTLNLLNLDVTQKCLIGECWCPSSDIPNVRLALKTGVVRP